MARDKKSKLEIGTTGEYQWLTATKESIDSILSACPQVVLDKYLAITSLDSGPVALSEEELNLGWESRNCIAYSKKIQSIEKLPHEWYDEWYVFNTPTDMGKLWEGNVFDVPLQRGAVATFVNFGDFCLQDPDPARQVLADLFWTQLEAVRPESYIADGDFLNFVSCDKLLFEIVRAAFVAHSSED